jgi:hypothetical protein
MAQHTTSKKFGRMDKADRQAAKKDRKAKRVSALVPAKKASAGKRAKKAARQAKIRMQDKLDKEAKKAGGLEAMAE